MGNPLQSQIMVACGMTGKKHEPKLHLDMPFVEAVERYVLTDPAEIDKSIQKKAKPSGGSKNKPKPDGKTVISLRDKRVKKRRTGKV